MIKALPKILTIFFFTVFILQIFSIAILLTAPQTALAGDAKFTPQVPIPGINYDSLMSEKSTKPIGEYVKAIYKYLIGIVGIIAVVVMMFGGLRWITAAGSAEGISEAKAWIGASLTGLVLVLGSYMILKTVNPDLVNFKTSTIPTIEETKTNKPSSIVAPAGCCQFQANQCKTTTETNCPIGWKGGDFTCNMTKNLCISELSQEAKMSAAMSRNCGEAGGICKSACFSPVEQEIDKCGTPLSSTALVCCKQDPSANICKSPNMCLVMCPVGKKIDGICAPSKYDAAIKECCKP